MAHHFGLSAYVGAILVSGFSLAADAGTAQASASVASPNAFSYTAKLLSPPARLFVNEKGSTEYDKKSWSVEPQSDGTELYTLKKKPEIKAAVLRSTSGTLESVTTYKLDHGEESGTLFYESGTLKAYTTCADRKEVGRVCLTATPRLCAAMKDQNISSDVMKEMDEYEMKSLSFLLNLRGSDHQLENMAKSGNRLGLKTALQTTQGQLLRLAKQVTKELLRSPSSAPEKLSPEAAAEDLLARTVITKSLPLLKSACAESGFEKI